MKKQLIQEINRQKEMMGVLHEQVPAPEISPNISYDEPNPPKPDITIEEAIAELLERVDNMNKEDIIDDLAGILSSYTEDEEFEFEGMPILQDPGQIGTPSTEYQIAHPDSLETME